MKKDFVYLASASPRRSALLRQLDVPFTVLAADIDEARRREEAPADYVVRMAEAKANRVWRSLDDEAREHPVLGADTVVVVDDAVLGKPPDAEEAERMLARLSGRAHTVLTAVALVHAGQAATALARSEVRFRATTRAERAAYCRTGEPLDKAGAYGIQGRGAAFIEHLEGSYSAVMGLPLLETAALLARFGLPRWLAAPDAS